MATRRTVGRLAGLVGAAAVLVIWGAAPAWAAPSITVDPSTDLVDNQVVAVSGTGYTPDTFLGVAMCEPNPITLSDCDLSPVQTINTDGGGNFSTTAQVRRYMVTNDGTTDCASAPGACVLGAGPPSFEQVATAPLSFDPDVPGTPPLEATITVGDRATVDRRSGVAYLFVTTTCNRTSSVVVDAIMEQASGFRITNASASASGDCDEDTRTLVLAFDPVGGRFSGGDAIVDGSASVSSGDGEFVSRVLTTSVHVVRAK